MFSIEKQEVLDMLSKKLNEEIHLSFDRLAILTGYSKRQLIRLSKSIQEKGIDSTLIHGNIGLVAHNRASIIELDYIKEFKKQYPKITIAQFRDIYLEDIIVNPDKSYDVKQYNLQPRSLAFPFLEVLTIIFRIIMFSYQNITSILSVFFLFCYIFLLFFML